MPAFVSVFAHSEAEVRAVLAHCKNVKVSGPARNKMYWGKGEWVGGPAAPPPVPVKSPELPSAVTTEQFRGAVEIMFDNAAYLRALLGGTNGA